MAEPIPHTVGSGNVFQDLELPEADVLLLKAGLASRITRVIETRGLTQRAAAELMGLDQPRVSLLTRGRLSGFSIERLLDCLAALQQDVTLHVEPTTAPRGRLLVAEPKG